MTTTIQQRTIYKNQDRYFLVLKKTPKTIATIEVEVWGMSERPSLRRITAKAYTTSDNVNGAFNITKRAKTELNNDIEFAYIPTSPFGFGKKKVLLSADKQLRGWEDTIDNTIETLERNFKNNKWIITEEDSETDFEDMEEANTDIEKECEEELEKELETHSKILEAIKILAKQKKEQGQEITNWLRFEMAKEYKRHENAKEDIYYKLP